MSRLLKFLGLGLILSLIFSPVALAAQHRMQKDIRTLIEQARNAWVARDANAIAQMFAPNGELIVPGQRWQGREEIRAGVTSFTQQYTDVKIDTQRVIVEGNQAVVEWHYEDTEKATGVRNKADDAIVIDFKDGLIDRWREYFDNKTPNGKTS
ncbi:MAG: nuclear transport factor 2 family protein [Chroococcidiopsidaceae cyanobacterium CP_BM_RX_35]|nr:nuclear transport factor 2 family protein [Chroococcidiopsidaceae cyanobacterium CP_BM_RX_35]